MQRRTATVCLSLRVFQWQIQDLPTYLPTGEGADHGDPIKVSKGQCHGIALGRESAQGHREAKNLSTFIQNSGKKLTI